MIDDLLYDLGLTKYQTKLYKSLLRLKEGKVSEISEEAGVPRNKAYSALESLYEDEYISISSKKPLKYRIVDPKSVLKSKVDRRISDLESLKENVVPNVSDFKEKSSSSNVSILSGRDLFFARMKEQLKNCEKSVLATIGTSRVDAELLKVEDEVTSKGVNMKFIADYNKDAVPRLKKHLDAGVDVRFSEQENVRFTVWDEKIVTFRVHTEQDENYYSIWVESPALARIMKSYFNNVWKSSSKKEEFIE